MTAPDGGVLNDCGCCAGVSVETPMAVVNRPGLSAIAYRIGTHARFKTSMLARLSESGLPALARLKTREDDDFTIALIDAWAIVLDVLTFYQERIANESYLRTATERGSIIDLARLIGYELRPGVAASTYLAFTLDSGPGAPESLTIDTRVRAQSIPGPGETPQSFETVEAIAARPEWNTLLPQQTALRYPVFGNVEMYLAGTATNLKPGDPILIVGAERASDKDSENWEIRRVSKVEPDATHKRTRVRWQEPLGSVLPHVDPPKVPTVYALRLQASLFGFNAPKWEALPVALRVGEKNPDPQNASPAFLDGAYKNRQNSWAEARLADGTTTINLDSVYSQVVIGSWLVLVKPAETGSPAYAEVYHVGGVGQEAKADFNITAKTTRVAISGENIDKFSPRNATVLAQSEELDLAETPLDDPLAGDVIVLDRVVDGLEPKRMLIVTGKRMRAVIGATRA
ncbi:MAG: putative baseplate assembly protein, partial [Vicinamibacterales bacterium]